MKVQVMIPKGLANKINNLYKELAEPVLMAVATETQHQLMNQKPPRAPRGSMRYASEKQRRYVMAAIASGEITVPYRRGIDSKSQRMNRSFKIVRSPREIALTNSASYWPYVIGDRQAAIHQGRWKTVDQVVTRIISGPLINDTVNMILKRKFG